LLFFGPVSFFPGIFPGAVDVVSPVCATRVFLVLAVPFFTQLSFQVSVPFFIVYDPSRHGFLASLSLVFPRSPLGGTLLFRSPTPFLPVGVFWPLPC